jgi:two-component system cell cycle sensor histidine kinase/response regulator CckA
MNATLRVLMVDDCEDDTLLIALELRRAGFSPHTLRVTDEKTMRDALDAVRWDVVLCDSSMPTFNAQRALALLAERHVDAPLILVSGSAGPSPAALDAMQRGARHFVSKNELWRLPPLLSWELGPANAPARREPAATPALSSAEELLLLRERLADQQHWVALGRMTAGIVHDLNNILAVVLACAAPLGADGDSPGREYVEEIEKATQRASALTHRVLDFTQGRRSKAQVINLTWVLEDLSKTLHRIVRKDIELVVASPLSLAPIRANGVEIEQVVLNLVVNARDAMSLGGTLTIALSNVTPGDDHPALQGKGPHVLLSVTDTGTGIDPSIKERIFEPLFTTKGAHGTGIGLSTVAEIVHRWGGTIGVESDVGKGTTFRVYLPSVESIEHGPWTPTVPPAEPASPRDAEA